MITTRSLLPDAVTAGWISLKLHLRFSRRLILGSRRAPELGVALAVRALHDAAAAARRQQRAPGTMLAR